MEEWRTKIVYVLLPAIVVAASILGYYAYKSVSQIESLGNESIANSTLLLVQEKVDRVEQRIIDADNAIFHLVDLHTPESIENSWPPLAERISPSVRAVMVLDEGGGVVAYSARASDQERREFLKMFLGEVLPDLDLPSQDLNTLKHLHHAYFGQSYLFSYKALKYAGIRYYIVLHHDAGYILREDFPSLFPLEGGRRYFNVVDDDGRRVFGERLTGAGEYIVGRQFPTTLYLWRLQVAPKLAPLLNANSRTRRYTETGLVGLALIIVLLGAVFVVYATDKERRLNALKSEFIANVSHELKTPLSVIRMFSEMLLTKRVKSEEKQEEYLQMICHESERLSTLIENVLDFAAIERGKANYQLRIANVGDVVQRAIETFRFRLERDGTDMKLDRAIDLPSSAVDEQAMLLAVINLLDNAVKYGGGTPVEISVKQVRGNVEVRVRDHGPGIPPEDIRRVFERFYRSKRDGQQRGSGIGLSLVQQIVEAHGGQTWAEAAPGGGAEITIAIPALTHGARLDTQAV